MIMTQTTPTVNDLRAGQGYMLYCDAKPITHCDSIDAARGWLVARWEEGAAEADAWNVQYRDLHPRHLSDEDVAGIIAQAEEIAETRYWEDLRHGF